MKWKWPSAPKFLFKTDKAPDLKTFIGKTVLIPEFADLDGKRVKYAEEKVVIERIVGHRFKHAFYEINGKYRIGMLRFHAQMLKDRSITEEQFQQFEEIQGEVERMPKGEENGQKEISSSTN